MRSLNSGYSFAEKVNGKRNIRRCWNKRMFAREEFVPIGACKINHVNNTYEYLKLYDTDELASANVKYSDRFKPLVLHLTISTKI